MKALLWTGVDTLEVKDIDRPTPGADEVLVRVSHVGVCGTDLHILHGEHPRAKAPLVLGHEFSGVIEQANPSAPEFARGDAVAVYPVIGCKRCPICQAYGEFLCKDLGLLGIDWNGGMAEFVKVPVDRLHKLPEGADLARAAVVEPLSVAVHTMKRSGIEPGATVAVIGAGPIGVCHALAAKHWGAKEVLVSDVSEFRLDVIRQIGCRPVHAVRESLHDAVMEATDGRGADYVFEATGILKAAEGLMELPRIRGMVVVVGAFPGLVPVNLHTVLFNELTVISSRTYTPEEFHEAMELIASGRIDVGPLITAVYPLDQGAEAFERFGAGADTEKVLIKAS